MDYATCIREAVYEHALTYGKRYPVLAHNPDPDRPKIKIQGDNGRVRWFPASCFDLHNHDLPRLRDIHIRDALDEPITTAIEVDLVMTNEQWRRCSFATPDALARFGALLPGTDVLINHGPSNMIIVSRISADIIEQTLRYLERQGQLFACTKSFEPQP